MGWAIISRAQIQGPWAADLAQAKHVSLKFKHNQLKIAQHMRIIRRSTGRYQAANQFFSSTLLMAHKFHKAPYLVAEIPLPLDFKAIIRQLSIFTGRYVISHF